MRAALRVLAREKLVKIVPGKGTSNTRRTGRTATSDVATFGLLSPLPLEQLRPRQVLWIDELREILSADGRLLRFVHGNQYFRASPAAALRRLVAQERCACWIIVRATKTSQAWFEREGVPCVIAGSCHPGIDLPFVDLDYRAMCRHAATLLLRHGHRRIAYLTTNPEAAGDLHSEAGFLDGVRDFKSAEAHGLIVRHLGEKKHIADSVRRLMAAPQPPTALLINQSYHYLTVASVLSRLGLRTPEDVSLICRGEDRFLSFLEPEPARYVEDPHLFARKLARITTTLLRERPAKAPHVMIFATLAAGGSIARPAGATTPKPGGKS